MSSTPTRPEMLQQFKNGLASLDVASHELDVVREEKRRLQAALKAANLTIARGKQRVLEGQRLQQLGRELKRRGQSVQGDGRIADGQRLIEDGAREVAAGIAQVRTLEGQLNALVERAARAREAMEDARRKVRQAEHHL